MGTEREVEDRLSEVVSQAPMAVVAEGLCKSDTCLTRI
jgi:hypothetical protein